MAKAVGGRSLLSGIGMALALAGCVVMLLLWGIPLGMPLPDGLRGELVRSTILTDEAGKPLRRFLVSGESVVLHYVTLEEMPPHFIEATVAAEDKRFWSHRGIDYAALLRASRDAARHGFAVSGASTITQQLVKLTSAPRPRCLRTKVLEMLGARKLEMLHDKRWILENYINRLPYGNLRIGCSAAAEGYFGKPVADLTLAEGALLAGLPNKPTRFNPYRNFPAAKERQQLVLQRMREEGYITEDEWKRAGDEKLRIESTQSVFQAPHAVELLLATRPEALRPGEVRTSLNLELQEFTEHAVAEHLHFIALHRSISPFLHAAVVVIENKTGKVRVLTGSRSYDDSRAGQINGAWVPRSPGSTLKPFTYLLALERGMPPSSVLADVPAEFVTKTGLYRPVNYDRSYSGPVSLRRALGNSLNVPAVRLLQAIGGPAALQEALTSCGISTLTEPDWHYGLGLTIGGAEVRLLELTNAYACLARLGEWLPWRLLEADEQPAPRRLFSPDSCYLLADILSDPAARAQCFGWNTALEVPGIRVAAKTGTSSDYRDGWTLGFTPDYTVGVWIGNFDHSPLDRFSGVAGAGPIFQAVMKRLAESGNPRWYERPAGVCEVNVDPRTGKQAERAWKPSRVAKELALRSAMPELARKDDYDAAGRVRLPSEYREWLETASATWKLEAVVRDDPQKPEFRITSPVEGMVIYLDPDLPDGGRRLRLRASGGEVIWTSTSLQIEGDVAHLVPGHHELVAEDPQTGFRKAVHIAVEQT